MTKAKEHFISIRAGSPASLLGEFGVCGSVTETWGRKQKQLYKQTTAGLEAEVKGKWLVRKITLRRP